MWRGRSVRVYDRDTGALLRVFQVGIEDPASAMQAIRAAHPELNEQRFEAASAISATAVVYSDLHPGEIRSLAANAIRNL